MVLFVISAALLFPLTSVLAYQHDLRDDLGSLNTSYFKAVNVGDTWVDQTNESNGYDTDTPIDCIEQYDWCRSGTGTGDYATWYPYPNPSPYWMCPYNHVAMQSNWAAANALYITESNGGGSRATSVIYQGYYLNAWYQLPNGRMYNSDYARVQGYGGGSGSITADATDFHFNPNNSSDSSCS
jgi:hypothetical protein